MYSECGLPVNAMPLWITWKALSVRATTRRDEQERTRIDPTRGRLLELLARTRSPKRVMEIGPGARYSAFWFMRSLNADATLDAVESSYP